MRLILLVSAALSPALATPAAAAEANTRYFGSATAAVMGGIVAGPVGLVAGAAIGYFLAPTLGSTLAPQPKRVARRRVHRAPAVAAPEPSAQPAPANAQSMYAFYVSEQPALPMPPAGAPNQVAQAAPPIAGQPMPAQSGYAVSPGAAQRPAAYATVPMPTALGPGGNYAAHAYKPQDGQAPDPLH